MYSGDELSVATAVWQFADAGVGNDKTVYISDLSLGGASAQNYVLVDSHAMTEADIQGLLTEEILPITLNAYLHAIQFFNQQKESQLNTEESNSTDMEISPNAVNSSGIQTLEGES